MDLPRGGAQAAALASLTQLLDGSHRATPDHLADVVARAGEPFGWDIVCYLVNFDQDQLVPFGPTSTDHLAAVPVGDDTGGLAFRHIRPVHTPDGITWIPVLDGVERMGVLRVTPQDGGASPEEHADELRWMSLLIGHLVAVMTRTGTSSPRYGAGPTAPSRPSCCGTCCPR